LRQGLLDVFLRRYLPAEVLETAEPEVRARNWLLYLPDLFASTPTLDTAMTAVCAARVGRETGDEGLVRHSMQLYTQGLSGLSRAIQHPDTWREDETLAACMALTMYEITECPGGHVAAYISHQNGAMKLVRARGSRAHASGLGRVLFLSMRLMAVSITIDPLQPTHQSHHRD
jgi:hypothetical protein